MASRKTVLRNCMVSIFALLAVGCAGVSYKAIETDEQDKSATGLRYYDSSPYLLVQTDNEGGLKSELKYLPDPLKKRSAKPYTFLAKNDTSFSFTEGLLTNASSEADATAVPKAVIVALEKVAGAAIGGRALQEGGVQEVDRKVPRVYLFKIVKRDAEPNKDGYVKRDSDGNPEREWGLIGAEGIEVEY